LVRGEMINLYNMDCMEAMKAMPDKAFELAIVDPPYGELSSVNNRLNRKMFNNIEPQKEYYLHLLRVSNNQIVWGVNYLQNYHFVGGGIVWNKLGIDTTRRAQAPTMSDAELAYQSFSKTIKIFSYTWIGNVQGNNYKIMGSNNNRIHPTQKPVALYQWLLKNYAKQGDRILDTHGGSCSSAIACDIMGFDADIYEIDVDYFNAAVDRFNRHKQQQVLAL
jgi:site-specific DNA-methyltransferase (adenine-specific)